MKATAKQSQLVFVFALALLMLNFCELKVWFIDFRKAQQEVRHNQLYVSSTDVCQSTLHHDAIITNIIHTIHTTKQVPNKFLCKNEETAQRRVNAKHGSTGRIASCNVKKETEEDFNRAILDHRVIKNSTDESQQSTYTVTRVTIKQEHAENTPPPPPVGRNSCAGGLSGQIRKEYNVQEKLDGLKKKYESSEAVNQKLEIRLKNLTSELESSKLKVATLESDKAQINLELVRLQVAYDGQNRTIKDLEQQNKVQQKALEFFSKIRSEVIDGLTKVKEIFLQHNTEEETYVDVKSNDQDSSVPSGLDEQRDELVCIAQCGVPTNADHARSVESQQPVQAFEGATATQRPGSLVSVAAKQKSTYASLAYRCKINPLLKCKMDTFLAKVEFFRSNVESQLKYPRNRLQKGLIVFNNCKEGFMISSSIWQDFMKNQSTYSLRKQFRCLLIGMLDSKALFYLSLAGQTRGKNKIHLAGVHCGLKSAVYAALKVHAKNAEYNNLYFEFERYLAVLRQKICIEDLPPADTSE